MLESIHSGIMAVSDILYRPWFVPLLLIIGGLYFTFRCKFTPGEAFQGIAERNNGKTERRKRYCCFWRADGIHSVESRYRQHNRRCHCYLSRRRGSDILDVDDRIHRRCYSICRIDTGPDLQEKGGRRIRLTVDLHCICRRR